MTENPPLVDTNILVYAFDADSGKKHGIAKDLLVQSFNGPVRYSVSVQNLAEFSVVVREKVAHPLPADDVRQVVDLLSRSRSWDVLAYSAKTILRAHRIRDEYTIHFWDALLVATMEENSVRTIVTEDTHFRNIPGIIVRNPFSAKS